MTTEELQGYLALEAEFPLGWPVPMDQSFLVRTKNLELVEVVATANATFRCSICRDAVALRFETPPLSMASTGSMAFAFTWGGGVVRGAVNGVLFETTAEDGASVVNIPDRNSSSAVESTSDDAEAYRPVAVRPAAGAISPRTFGRWELAGSHLTEAKATLSRMEAAKDRAEFEATFGDLCHRLKLSWEDLCSEGKIRFGEKFNGWKGKQVELIRKDSVLRYLKGVRDKAEHDRYGFALVWSESTVQLVGVQSGIFLKGLRSDGEGGFLASATTLQGQPADVEFLLNPGEASLPRLEILYPSSKEPTVFEPPTHHLGKLLQSGHPVAVAGLGIEFYEKCLREAIDEFGK